MLGQRDAAEDRGDGLGVLADLRGDLAELRRLVAEDDEIGLLRERGVGRERLAAELVDERLGAAGQHVGGEDGSTPATRHPARHVPCPDESDLHARHCSRQRGRA